MDTRARARARIQLVPLARPRGFQSGSSNPGVQRSAFLAARAARYMETKRLRVAAARAALNPDGVDFTCGGVRGRLSQRERALVLHHTLKLGRTQLEAAAAVGVSQQSVSRILQSARAPADSGAGAADGSAEQLVTPPRSVKRSRGGRPSLLTPASAASVTAAVHEDPFGGVRAVHEALKAHGIEASARTLYRWLDALNVHAHATNLYAALDERLIHGILNHVEGMAAALARGDLTQDNIVYGDQTPIYICTGHNHGYSDTAVFGDAGDAKGGVKVGNLWAVVTNKCCLRAWVTDLSGSEETAKDFFRCKSLPPGWVNLYGADGNIFDLIAAHGRTLKGRCRKMILCLDRLGKFGMSEYAVAGHHAPELRNDCLKAGVGLLLLCPKGALVNPIELWNMHVKALMLAAKPDGSPKDAWGQFIRGPRDKATAFKMLTDAIAAIDAKPETLRWCYHARATGAHALQRLEGHAVAQAVRAARAAQPVPPFDVVAAAFAPRARMSTQHPYPSSALTAETYNVYYYRHHRLQLADDLPPPFERPKDADGSERRCRLCKPNTKGAQARDTLLVCCDNCSGVYHYECLELEAPPAGNWECAACALGGIGDLRKWVNAHPKPRAAQAPRKRRRAPDSDEERASSDDE